jgi:ribosome biogenesis SPOUT family RNA methylase Rps3
MSTTSQAKIFVVEHLDPELEEWSALEYAAIAKESLAAGAQFRLSSVPQSLILPDILRSSSGLIVEHDSVEDLFENHEVCLLDPAATNELSPDDGEKFRIFLFGGILGELAAAQGNFPVELMSD